MSEIKLTNKRTVYSTEVMSENVKLVGQLTVNEDGSVKEANGDIRMNVEMGEAYIGNYSLYGVNVNNDMYIKYRTEASQLLDELTASFENGAIDQEGGEA